MNQTEVPSLQRLAEAVLESFEHGATTNPGALPDVADDDQAMAAARNIIASYGVNLADPTAARAVMAVMLCGTWASSDPLGFATAVLAFARAAALRHR